MSQETTKKVWVLGLYNWPKRITKEQRIKDKNYPRHNWVDIDVIDIHRYNAVLDIYKKYGVDCISHRLGKGWHFFGDEVPFELWLKLWLEIKPYADPRWPPHCIRISRKKQEEVWLRPVFHDLSNSNGPKPWMKGLMYFLCKVLRNEASNDLRGTAYQCGIDKYFQEVLYLVEIKQNGNMA